MKYVLALAAFTVAAPALAEESPAPMVVAPVTAAEPQLVLPANTEVLLRMNDTITTKGKTYNEGDTFGLTVAQDVFLQDLVIIPRGARATGRITWLTSKGAFGKSGKMDVGLEYVEVGGRRIPLSGTYRQEGEGNTVATVGGVIAAGIFAGFITGKSAVIPQGRELMARTKDDLPIRVAARPATVPAYASAQTVTVSSPAPSDKQQANWGLVSVTPK